METDPKLESMVDYEFLNSPLNANSSDMLKKFLFDKADFLRGIIEEIQGQIKKRAELHQEVLSDISQIQSKCKSVLLNLPRVYIGTNPLIDSRRDKFEQLMFTLDKDKSAEKVNFFKDVNLFC